MLYAVIMAGGSGTRFWPRSRADRPKQLIRIAGPDTMIRQTAARLAPDVPPERTFVVTNQAQVAMTAAQLPGVPADHIIGEPCGRDTTACIGLGAEIVVRAAANATPPDTSPTLVVLPADQVIQPAEEFRRTLGVAERVARETHALITFGIPPKSPSALFGYIHRGERLAVTGVEQDAVYRVSEFKEKPDAGTAARYVDSGDYYWNSGIFVWRACDILDALAQFMPELRAGLARISQAWDTPRGADVLAREYAAFEKISIDYAVMEKAPNRVVIEARYEWDDVGSWEAAARLQAPDASGNAVLVRHEGMDTTDCVIAGEKGHLVATIGVSGLIIVQTPDVTLVCDRSRAADVKKMVERLREKGMTRLL